MDWPFGECWQRLNRAHAHRESITQLWDSLGNDDLYEAAVEVEHDGRGIVRAYPKGIPVIINLQLGEILYQLRAALNGAVQIAVILETGQDPPPNEDKLEFPIRSSKVDFEKAARKLDPLSEKRRAIVEAVQPYHGGAVAEAIGRINDWAKRDRHRRIHLVGSWTVETGVDLKLPPERIKSLTVIESGFLEDNPEVAKFELCGVAPHTDFDANIKLSTDIAVKDTPPVMLKGTIVQMIAAAYKVVEGFEASFEQGTPP